jgi:hypothetical protein
MSFNLDRTPQQLFSKQMANLKLIQLIQDDVNRIAQSAEPCVRRLDDKIQYLNQAYVVHLIAAWQVFIEDSLRFGFKLFSEPNAVRPSHQVTEDIVNEAIERFNTPSRRQIDRLFKKVLGIDGISECWKCESFTAEAAIAALDRILTARHEIAHTANTATPLSFQENFKDMEILVRMAALTEEALRRRILVK